MMQAKQFDVVVIGGGPAGLTAGLYAVRGGATTLLIEREFCGGQMISTGEIENYPGVGKITGADLSMQMTEHAMEAGVEIVYEEIESVDLEGKLVKTADAEYLAKSIIVATGARPRKLGCEGEEKFLNRGVHFCGICDGAVYKGKDIVVVGGGNSAVEEALYLGTIAKSVTIVNATEKFNAEEANVKQLGNLGNLSAIHHNSTIKSINAGADGKLESVTTTAGDIPASAVFVAIGRVPSTELFGDSLELDKWGYIKTDANMQTNIGGIYAAGDVTSKAFRQITTAVADGTVAALGAVHHAKN